MVIAGVNLVTRTDTDDFWREYVRLLLERVVRQKYNGSEQTEQEWIPFLRDTVRLSSGRVRQQRQRARCLSPEGEFAQELERKSACEEQKTQHVRRTVSPCLH